MLLFTLHASLLVYFDYTVAYNRKILVALSPGRRYKDNNGYIWRFIFEIISCINN